MIEKRKQYYEERIRTLESRDKNNGKIINKLKRKMRRTPK